MVNDGSRMQYMIGSWGDRQMPEYLIPEMAQNRLWREDVLGNAGIVLNNIILPTLGSIL